MNKQINNKAALLEKKKHYFSKYTFYFMFIYYI